MAEISILKSEYPNLKDCEVGEPLDLAGTVTAINGDTLTIEVSDVDYGEESEVVEPEVTKPNPVSKISAPAKKRYG